MEFEQAMKSHQKFVSTRTDSTQNTTDASATNGHVEENSYEEKSYTKKDLGGVDVGVSSVPAAGLGLRTLEDEKKELQAKLASYRAKRLQKDQEDENELSGMIANMKNEQNARAKKWKNDDQERLNRLESDLFERKKNRALEESKRREELKNLNTDIRLTTEANAENMLEEVKQSKIDAQVESAMSHVTVSDYLLFISFVCHSFVCHSSVVLVACIDVSLFLTCYSYSQEEDPEILAARAVEEAEKARKQFEVKAMLARSEAALLPPCHCSHRFLWAMPHFQPQLSRRTEKMPWYY
jgi:hypothetical protein